MSVCDKFIVNTLIQCCYMQKKAYIPTDNVDFVHPKIVEYCDSFSEETEELVTQLLCDENLIFPGSE